jgi:glycosyltransferase involved in cell wall biosynthesis
MSTSPLISVIMPVYNTERFVGEAIQSILDQTFQNFELIIIDDGSTDASWEIIQKYVAQDQRIRAYQNEDNQRLVFTRNIALSKVSTNSNYIAICDADDTVSPQWLQETYNYMESQPNISAVGIDLQYMDVDGNLGKEYHYPKTSQAKKNAIFRMSPLSHGGSLIRIADWKQI